MASNRWNLSTDYYNVQPADSEMDGEDRCEECDGLPENKDYYIPIGDRCDCER